MAGTLAAGSAPTLAIVGSDKDNDADDALGAAVQNAALDDIHVAEDEKELIRLHQSGEIDSRQQQPPPRGRELAAAGYRQPPPPGRPR